MDRAERRRQERAAKKQPVIIAGDGMIAEELTGSNFEAIPHAKLPDKVPGKHRWTALASYVLSDDLAASAMDADTPKFLDHENLFFIGVGCYDCELPIQVAYELPCPGDPADG